MVIPLVADKQAEIVALCERYGVRRLELFGSAATGTYDPLASDIDLLVTYPEEYDFGPWLGRHFELRDDLIQVLGPRVDLVLSDALRHDWFREEVESTREVLYDAATNSALAH
jgi:predicted nucleotidyltransferase